MKAVAFDLSAMFVSAAGDAPRGIDRVDMGYAKQFFAGEMGGNVGLLPSASGMGVLTGAEAARLAAVAEGRWQEASTPHDDVELSDWLNDRLRGRRAPRPARRRGRRTLPQTVLRYADLALHARGALFRAAARNAPHGVLYVNTGQSLLRWSRFFEWLDHRPDVKPVFMLHDLIPIFFPEYTGPVMARAHEQSLDVAARRAAAMIATSKASAAEIGEALSRRGRSDMPIHVAPLPVGDAFLTTSRTSRFDGAPPYFVVVGSIDQRKNHLLLLEAWRAMADSMRGDAPKLVVVGARGARSSGLVDLLSRSRALSETVIEANGLSTPAMRELMRSARALLTPSFTEGFGLPIIEALALGTPVVASDIPAHREVGGVHAAYLDPLDGPGWIAEITARAEESTQAAQARRSALASYRPQTWASYFDEVLPFLDSL